MFCPIFGSVRKIGLLLWGGVGGADGYLGGVGAHKNGDPRNRVTMSIFRDNLKSKNYRLVNTISTVAEKSVPQLLSISVTRVAGPIALLSTLTPYPPPTA